MSLGSCYNNSLGNETYKNIFAIQYDSSDELYKPRSKTNFRRGFISVLKGWQELKNEVGIQLSITDKKNGAYAKQL
ncbi:hypothetical protein G7074_00715 [Pedobacter sp. HDW13]|uniref:hypothetical protein n=1 Tax=unclassified Pedobacter TaxID=2628915 RepID=UPI000F59B027|nr:MULTISPECIES: hypothetical protein [unclassified Pedobacter]QIL37934.1 hypothetical protein G7074_00715 [Pedobacter sp. HDW13]RQO68935.1 hypothetical protein DBR40_18285 [Pedobacter sp. KBW01]